MDTTRITESKAEVSDRRAGPASGFAATAEQYLAERRVDAARELCLHGVSQAPWYAPGHIVMAKVCVESGDYEAAIESLRRAIQLDPMNSVAHTLLGQVRLLQGDREGATKALEEALFLCPANPVAVELIRRANEPEPAEPPAMAIRPVSILWASATEWTQRTAHLQSCKAAGHAASSLIR